MKYIIKPIWRVDVEGDARLIFNAFRTAKEVLNQKFYDQWLETRSPLFDDDPDECTGSFEIEGSKELLELIHYLTTRIEQRDQPKIEISARWETPELRGEALLLCGDTRDKRHTHGEVQIDTNAIQSRVTDVVHKVIDQLEEAIQVDFDREHSD